MLLHVHLKILFLHSIGNLSKQNYPFFHKKNQIEPDGCECVLTVGHHQENIFHIFTVLFLHSYKLKDWFFLHKTDSTQIK